MISIVRDSSISHFLEQTKAFLYADEATNSLMIGLCEGLANSSDETRGPVLLIRILEDGKAISAASQTLPHNLALTHATSQQLTALANYLISIHASFPGVVGPGDAAEEFAQVWSELRGQRFNLGMAQKIYKLEEVSLHSEISGAFRQARSSETDLLTQWLVEFGQESLPPNEQKTFAERRPYIEGAMKKGLAHVWEVDGLAVAMAFAGRPTQNGISVSGVYTPKSLRKHGYASAVVAHLSQAMLDAGKKFCVLYTDPSNPTSNRIYQNIGYQEVSESKMFLFDHSDHHNAAKL